MRVDVGQPFMDGGYALGIRRGLGLGQQARALRIGREHNVEQRLRTAGGFLRHPADARVAGQANAAVVGADLAAMRRSNVDLPVPLRPTKPTLCPVGIPTVALSRIIRPSMR